VVRDPYFLKGRQIEKGMYSIVFQKALTSAISLPGSAFFNRSMANRANLYLHVRYGVTLSITKYLPDGSGSKYICRQKRRFFVSQKI